MTRRAICARLLLSVPFQSLLRSLMKEDPAARPSARSLLKSGALAPRPVSAGAVSGDGVVGRAGASEAGVAGHGPGGGGGGGDGGSGGSGAAVAAAAAPHPNYGAGLPPAVPARMLTASQRLQGLGRVV